MKRKLAVLLICVLTLSFVGCGSGDITLDKRENELVAEYIAGEMLKFSYDNEWDYTKVRTALNTYESNGTAYYNTSYSSQQATTAAGTTTATTAATVANSTATTAANSTTAANGTGSTTATTAASDSATDVYTALAGALGVTGATISVKGCSADVRYPMEEYAVCISAKDGYKVVAVEFDIKNTSSSDITINTSSSSVTMRLAISGKNVVQTASMLANDIISLKDVSVKAGETYTAVACFQVPDSYATGEATVNVYKSGSSIGTISGLKVE